MSIKENITDVIVISVFKESLKLFRNFPQSKICVVFNSFKFVAVKSLFIKSISHSIKSNSSYYPVIKIANQKRTASYNSVLIRIVTIIFVNVVVTVVPCKIFISCMYTFTNSPITFINIIQRVVTSCFSCPCIVIKIYSANSHSRTCITGKINCPSVCNFLKPSRILIRFTYSSRTKIFKTFKFSINNFTKIIRTSKSLPFKSFCCPYSQMPAFFFRISTTIRFSPVTVKSSCKINRIAISRIQI